MNLFTLFFIFLKFILVITSLSVDENIDEIIELTTTEMILKLGYPLEVHTIQTTDGYILDLHRIPHGGNNKTSDRFAPVIIYAGLLGDSACFACWAPESSIGYILADQGYDVWLGNTRGTTHGKKHIKWDPYENKKKFWNFSFQEMATYDVPESINYVLNITKSENLYYIGHSQGSTIAFAMLAEKPTYNKKIRLLITLAPLVSIKHSTLPIIKIVLKDFLYFKALFEKYEFYEIMPFSKRLKQLALFYCNNNSTMKDVCHAFMCFSIGCNRENLNKKYFPLVLSNLPAGASIKQLAHYMQLHKVSNEKHLPSAHNHLKKNLQLIPKLESWILKQDKHDIIQFISKKLNQYAFTEIFHKYDYGKEKNLKIYNTELPPIYNLSNTQVPTALFFGTGDVISAYQDVELLATKLPKIIYKKKIKSFNHIDLLYGTETNNLVNTDIVNLIKMH